MATTPATRALKKPNIATKNGTASQKDESRGAAASLTGASSLNHVRVVMTSSMSSRVYSDVNSVHPSGGVNVPGYSTAVGRRGRVSVRRILVAGLVFGASVFVFVDAAHGSSCPPPGSTVSGNLVIAAGPLCNVTGDTITGNLIVSAGAGVTGHGVTVDGSVIGQNPSGSFATGPYRVELYQFGGPKNMIGGSVSVDGASDFVAVNGSTIGGNLMIQRSRAVCVGDPESDEGCASAGGDTVNGSVLIANNNSDTTAGATFAANVIFEHNTVHGSVNVNNNSAVGTITVEDNAVGTSLNCSGNSPAPTDLDGTTPEPNTAGTKTGQCTSL